MFKIFQSNPSILTNTPRALFLLVFLSQIMISCSGVQREIGANEQIVLSDEQKKQIKKLTPVFISDTVPNDSDDPAIWIHPEDPSLSLIIGTDKKTNGGLYVFNIKGEIIPSKTVAPLDRPNNVDVGYGLEINGISTDIAVTTERNTGKIRVFALPSMEAIDNGGIKVFEGEEHQSPMGIALYKDPNNAKMYAIVGRKDGPEDGYLWQYELLGTETGSVEATFIRAFGKYSGKKEIEAIAVDKYLGYVYYSDEQYGVRKYHADPNMGNEELALFATEGFTADQEGISIYYVNETQGYILVSDQQANCFHIFTREGTKENPHEHHLAKIIHTSTLESDGSEMASVAINPHFPYGLFVAMSTDKTFHYYSWEDIAGSELRMIPTQPVVKN